MAAHVLKMAPAYVLLLWITCVFCQKPVMDLKEYQQDDNILDSEDEAGPSATDAIVRDDSLTWGRGFCIRPCKCGIPNRKTRIAGGKHTLTNEYPWVAGLRQFGRIFCGGTLINDRHVLTAAQCVLGNIIVVRLLTTVVIGERDVFFRPPLASKRINNVIRHEYFRPRTEFSNSLDNDIALIILAEALELGPKLSPACMPTPGIDLAGKEGTAVGWGRRGETQISLIQSLLAVDIPILDQQVCRIAMNYESARPNPKIRDSAMCAGRLEGRAGPCGADMGGPLLVPDAMNRTAVVGIMSWSEGCGRPHRPAVYTRVTEYLAWIQRFTRDACFCG